MANRISIDIESDNNEINGYIDVEYKGDGKYSYSFNFDKPGEGIYVDNGGNALEITSAITTLVLEALKKGT